MGEKEHARLYRTAAWRGEGGIRDQALIRDLYTCQRCGVSLVTGRPNHPRAATVNHIKAHKGDPALFFELSNTESACKSCHDGAIQRSEARGYTIGSDASGRPVDPHHPWNQ